MTMRVLFTVSVVAAGLVLAPAPPANALANRPLSSDPSGRCMEVVAPAGNGAAVQLATCDGDDDQAWTWYNDGTISSSLDGRCLDLDITSRGPDGSPYLVQTWDCHGGENQQWIDGWTPGQILSAHSDGALEASPTLTDPDPKWVQVWHPNRGHGTQYWSCDCRVPYPSR